MHDEGAAPKSIAYLKRALSDLTPAEADVLLCVEMMCQAVLADSRIVAHGAEKFCQLYRFAAIAKRTQYADAVRRLAGEYIARGVDERYATPRVVLDSLVSDYAHCMSNRGVFGSGNRTESTLLHMHIRTAAATPEPWNTEVARFYAARAGRSVDDVLPADAAELDAWASSSLFEIARPVVECEGMFSVLYAATAEYLANCCRNEMEGKDIDVDVWLAEHGGHAWRFPPRAENGDWFVSVSDALNNGLGIVSDWTLPYEAQPDRGRDRGWYRGRQDFAPDALMYQDAVDHLVVRAGQMIAQLQRDGVRV